MHYVLGELWVYKAVIIHVYRNLKDTRACVYLYRHALFVWVDSSSRHIASELYIYTMHTQNGGVVRLLCYQPPTWEEKVGKVVWGVYTGRLSSL